MTWSLSGLSAVETFKMTRTAHAIRRGFFVMATRIPMIDVQSREERDRDLGFGSLVSQQRHVRLLNRDGSFNVRRKQSWLDAVASYHALLTLSWPAFIALVATLSALGDLIFELCFFFCGGNVL